MIFDILYGDINGQNIYSDAYEDELMGYEPDTELFYSPKNKFKKITNFEVKHETKKAILVKKGKYECWLPKSQISLSKYEMKLPTWLLNKHRELI